MCVCVCVCVCGEWVSNLLSPIITVKVPLKMLQHRKQQDYSEGWCEADKDHQYISADGHVVLCLRPATDRRYEDVWTHPLDPQIILFCFVYMWRTLPPFLASHRVLGTSFSSENSSFIQLWVCFVTSLIVKFEFLPWKQHSASSKHDTNGSKRLIFDDKAKRLDYPRCFSIAWFKACPLTKPLHRNVCVCVCVPTLTWCRVTDRGHCEAIMKEWFQLLILGLTPELHG